MNRRRHEAAKVVGYMNQELPKRTLTCPHCHTDQGPGKEDEALRYIHERE